MKQLFMALPICLILVGCDPDHLVGLAEDTDFYIKNELQDTCVFQFTGPHYNDKCVVPVDSSVCCRRNYTSLGDPSKNYIDGDSVLFFNAYMKFITSVKLMNTQDSVLMEWVPDSTYKKSFYDITQWTWICTDSKLDRYKWIFTINPEDLE